MSVSVAVAPHMIFCCHRGKHVQNMWCGACLNMQFRKRHKIRHNRDRLSSGLPEKNGPRDFPSSSQNPHLLQNDATLLKSDPTPPGPCSQDQPSRRNLKAHREAAHRPLSSNDARSPVSRSPIPHTALLFWALDVNHHPGHDTAKGLCVDGLWVGRSYTWAIWVGVSQVPDDSLSWVGLLGSEHRRSSLSEEEIGLFSVASLCCRYIHTVCISGWYSLRGLC